MEKIQELSITVVACIAVFLGMFTFMYDLGYYYDGTQKYNLTVPAATNASMNLILANIENDTSTLKSVLTGQESWIQTAFSVFFKLPSTTASTMSLIFDSANALLSLGVGEESKIPIPGWFVGIVLLLIMLIVVFSLVYFVSGRRV